MEGTRRKGKEEKGREGKGRGENVTMHTFSLN